MHLPDPVAVYTWAYAFGREKRNKLSLIRRDKERSILIGHGFQVVSVVDVVTVEMNANFIQKQNPFNLTSVFCSIFSTKELPEGAPSRFKRP